MDGKLAEFEDKVTTLQEKVAVLELNLMNNGGLNNNVRIASFLICFQ
jgi:hypothetical protein